VSTGQIHDLGYKRYVGSRRSVDTRWMVIMRHQLSTAWKGWWRFKAALIAALIATFATGTVMYFLRNELFRMLGAISGEIVRFSDGLLPFSLIWYCKIGFLVSLLVCSTVVAGDVQSGAFTFYFARSVRPRDYVLGKLAGLGILLSAIMVAGPVLLAGFRLGLADNLDQVVALLPTLPKALAIGALGTVIYAVVPLGFSALVSNPRYAMALWAAYDIVIGGIAEGIGHVGTSAKAVAAFDLPSALQAVAYDLFGMRIARGGITIPTWAAVTSIAVHAVLAIAVVIWRVRRAQQTGVGGAS
jgi:hypothetical protein